MSGSRGLTIALATLATIVAVFMLLLIPVSLTLGRYLNVVLEAVVLVTCVGYVARVMRADRRRRREAEAALPPERRPERRVPRRPITFQFRETLIAFLVWFVLVIAFNSLVVQLGPIPNVGIAVFAAFMLATLTVTGRHMMFRLTAEEETPPER
jgi:membrane protein implicated in regulation of membrane protease activity